jgi:hypothetical protein
MKKLSFIIILLLAINVQALALGSVRNLAACRIIVTLKCYDLCVLVNSTTFPVNSGQTVPVSSTFCNSSNFVIATICWDPTPCPNGTCTTIDASNPAAPSPCSPGTTTGSIVCADCGSGTASVTFSGTQILVQ